MRGCVGLCCAGSNGCERGDVEKGLALRVAHGTEDGAGGGEGEGNGEDVVNSKSRAWGLSSPPSRLWQVAAEVAGGVRGGGAYIQA